MFRRCNGNEGLGAGVERQVAHLGCAETITTDIYLRDVARVALIPPVEQGNARFEARQLAA